MPAILLFIDGSGWGGTDPAVNPQHAYGGGLLRLPSVSEGADGPVALPRGGWARPADAVLGVDGVPQSATGQTTLLTGVNGQAAFGKHLTGFPNDALRAILREHSILRQVTGLGHTACFLNSFRDPFFDFPRERQLRYSATTVANLAADLPFFRPEDIVAGRSIYQEFQPHRCPTRRPTSRAAPCRGRRPTAGRCCWPDCGIASQSRLRR